MDDEELIQGVRRLRADGYAPKEIARALGVRPAVVAPLVQRIAAERPPAEDELDLATCWVSPGWRAGLTIKRQPEWPDGDGDVDAEVSGLVAVLLARGDRRRRLSVCGYLLDVWCLGVKNVFGPTRMDPGELALFRRSYFAPWESSGVRAPIELARELVFGAAAYARTLGFNPHPDFERAHGHLGTWESPSAIGFGRNGTPFYADGPYDDPEQVLRTLEESVGQGNFHFAVSVGHAEPA